MSSSGSNLGAVLLSAVLLSGGALGCGAQKGGGATTGGPDLGSAAVAKGSSTGDGASAGPRAPDFTLPSLEGKNISLSDYAGKVVLVNFWSTTCDPCMVEMPHLVRLYEKHKGQGFVVLAVSADGPETRAQVSSVVHDKRMSFPVLLDEETSVIARYNPKKDMPFSALIDQQGNVVRKTSGYSPGDELKLASDLDRLLK